MASEESFDHHIQQESSPFDVPELPDTETEHSAALEALSHVTAAEVDPPAATLEPQIAEKEQAAPRREESLSGDDMADEHALTGLKPSPKPDIVNHTVSEVQTGSASRRVGATPDIAEHEGAATLAGSYAAHAVIRAETESPTAETVQAAGAELGRPESQQEVFPLDDRDSGDADRQPDEGLPISEQSQESSAAGRPKDDVGHQGPPEPPDMPREAVFEPPRPSQLAMAIDRRWEKDRQFSVDDDPHAPQDPTRSIALEEPVVEAMRRTRAIVVEQQLQHAETEMSPEQLVYVGSNPEDVDDLVVERHFQRSGDYLSVEEIEQLTGVLDYNRMRASARAELTGHITVEAERWKGQGSIPYDVHEHTRLMPAARQVAEEHDIELWQVFDPDVIWEARHNILPDQFYIEAFKMTYGSPEAYLAERQASLAAQGPDAAREDVINSLALGLVGAGLHDFSELRNALRQSAPLLRYVAQIQSGLPYEQFVQATYQYSQQIGRAQAWTKMRWIWGEEAVERLLPIHSEWLYGSDIDSADIIIPDDGLTEVTSSEQRDVEIRDLFMTYIAHADLRLDAIDILLITDYISDATAWVGALSETEVRQLVRLVDDLTWQAQYRRTSNEILALDISANPYERTLARLAEEGRQHEETRTADEEALIKTAASICGYGDGPDDEGVSRHYINSLRVSLVEKQFRLAYPMLFPQRSDISGMIGYSQTAYFAILPNAVRVTVHQYFDERLRRSLGMEPDD